ncbi:MAG: hypothetical protein ACRDJP_00800 [Actinomycetota bacterium]
MSDEPRPGTSRDQAVRGPDVLETLRAEIGSSFADAAEALREGMQGTLQEGLAAIRREIASAQTELLAAVVRDRLASAVEKIRADLETSTGAVRDQVAHATAALRDELQRGIEAVRSATNAATSAVQGASVVAAERFEAQETRMRESLGEIDRGLGDLPERIGRIVDELLDDRLGTVSDRVSSVEGTLRKALESAWTRLDATVGARRDELESRLGERIDAVRRLVEERATGTRDVVVEGMTDLRSAIDEGLRAARDATSSIGERIDEVGVNVGRFGTALAAELTRALDRAREEVPDMEAQFRGSVEEELGQLRDQVASGMAALLRQMDAIRGRAPGTAEPGPQRPPA